MAGLQRFITYINKYENDEKMDNSGFAKIEIRGSICRVEVHIRNISIEKETATVYLFARKEDFIQGIPVGDMEISRGGGDVRYAFDTKEVLKFGLTMNELEGIFIPTEENSYLASQWKEGAISGKHFRILEEKKSAEKQEQAGSNDVGAKTGRQQDVRVRVEGADSEEIRYQDINKDTADDTHTRPAKEQAQTQRPDRRQNDSGMSGQSGIQPQKQPGQENRQPGQENRQPRQENRQPGQENRQPQEQTGQRNRQSDQEGSRPQEQPGGENQQSGQTDRLQKNTQEDINIRATELPIEEFLEGKAWGPIYRKLRLKNGIYFPFEGQEIECIRMSLNDLREFPQKYWYLGKNSFLLHGFFNYRHILFGEMTKNGKKEYFIGIPGIFQNQERIMASMFGFPEFRTAANTEYKTGNFGYWYRII